MDSHATSQRTIGSISIHTSDKALGLGRDLGGKGPPRDPGRVRAALISLGGSYVGALLTLVKGILLVPVFLRIFGIEIYGAFLASANVVGLLGIVDLGLSAVLSQRLAEAWGARNRLLFSQLAGAGLLVVFGLAAVMLATSMVIAPLVPGLVRAPESSRSALSLTFVLTASGSALTLVTTNLLSIGSAWQRSEIVAASRLGGQIVDLVVLGLGLYTGMGVTALGLGSVVGAAAGFTIAAVWTTVQWRALSIARPTGSRADIVLLARITAPMMLSRVALQIGSNVEVALVAALVNPAAAAVYGLTDRILRVAASFVNPIAGSVLSALAHYVGEQGRHAAVAPARELFSVWSLVVAASLPPLIALNRDFTTLWVGSANFGGFSLNFVLCAAAILASREFALTVVLTSTGAISTVAWINIIEVAFRLPLMYGALHVVGSVGVPLSSIVVSSVFVVLYTRFTSRQLALSGGAARSFGLLGSLSITTSFALGIVEALALPRVTTWGPLLLKGALVAFAHLFVAVLLNQAGTAILVRRFIRPRTI